jgi:hypothetical protein
MDIKDIRDNKDVLGLNLIEKTQEQFLLSR